MAVSDTRICVDANVVVHGLGTRVAPRLAEMIADWIDSGLEFHVPSIWRYEVTNALFRAANGGLIDADRLTARMNALWDLPLVYHDEIGLHERAAAIATAIGASAAYDAHYLALAERLAITFYTSDARFHRIAAPHFSDIELLPIA